ncbi:flagellar hook-basal body complex protein [Bacillus lacus]|uniref:Flagellar hook-basal body complex protein n=1 Tax=Metabacillus lacus TaxID=1983721 RepID=A0A7X2J0T2_9BACI|nr:flagellar hook-basal body protein [Metabacillus lacus]MRX73017.1 flagellar hook-basal body complex protein [Metabacillus lacus]
MLRTMVTASNTMYQLQKQLDVIGNNISNIDTQGFKKESASFGEMIRQQMDNQPQEKNELGRSSAMGLREGNGAHLNIKTVFSQGIVKKTDRNLDLAFAEQDQFLQISTENGIRYTRDGALYLSPAADGRLMLATAEGLPVSDSEGNPILLEENFKDIVISKQGVLTTVPAVPGGPVQTAQLGIVKITSPQHLEKTGSNLYAIDNNRPLDEVLQLLNGPLRNEVNVQQGFLESSNVDLSKEISDLMIAQRSFQMNAKSISIGDQMLGLINSVR